jgi:hypothetical protein
MAGVAKASLTVYYIDTYITVSSSTNISQSKAAQVLSDLIYSSPVFSHSFDLYITTPCLTRLTTMFSESLSTESLVLKELEFSPDFLGRKGGAFYGPVRLIDTKRRYIFSRTQNVSSSEHFQL